MRQGKLQAQGMNNHLDRKSSLDLLHGPPGPVYADHQGPVQVD
jgi:hypothetical protein